MVLDCTKALNLEKYNILFERLLARGLASMVVGVLALSYEEQMAWVRWGRTNSIETFNITNRTRQGSVKSPAFWSIYIDPLFQELKNAGIHCHLGGLYRRVVGYADDQLI